LVGDEDAPLCIALLMLRVGKVLASISLREPPRFPDHAGHGPLPPLSLFPPWDSRRKTESIFTARLPAPLRLRNAG